MQFYYIRHGDPIYHPDSLTELGKKQAEALSNRLLKIGLDEIYASTSNRAAMTALPTCEALGMDMTLVDFANELYAWNEFAITINDKKKWLFQENTIRQLFCEPSMRELGWKWYLHPALSQYNYNDGIERIYRESAAFFEKLGYHHIINSGKYKVIFPNDKKVALFAHQGFGLAFLSCVLDIPYPQICNHFDMCHTGVTVIDFKNEHGYAIPKVKTWSSDSHLYALQM